MLATSILDKNPPHRFGGDGEEVAAAVPGLVHLGPDEPQVSLVNQRGGLERLPGILPSQSPLGETAQLVIDQGAAGHGRLVLHRDRSRSGFE